MKSVVFSLLFSLLMLPAYTQNDPQQSHLHQGRAINFPDVPGYLTLKCDFHQHTVFSDGNVWPTIRVEEALKDHLDAISLTDHIEYQPHKEDIPHPDRNRGFEIAKKFAKSYDIMIVNGTEITRDMPPGHCNGIFVKDVNKLMDKDPMDVFRAAKKQDAFVFWNHPHWTSQRSDGIVKLDEMHKELIAEKLIQGIEVVNNVSYSDEALQVALDNKLTIMGTSDIHGLIDWQYKVPEGGHRPVTLVFAEKRTEKSMKEALFEGRTAVWFNNTLIGLEEHLVPLIQSCLQVTEAKYPKKQQVATVTIENRSDADFQLENLSPYTFHRHAGFLTVKANGTTDIHVKTVEKIDAFDLKFRVLNGVTAPDQHPVITLHVNVEK